MREHVLVDLPIPPDVPPTYLGVAGMDPLRGQGERLGEQLREAGATVHLERFDNVVHGFATMLVVDECKRATDAAARSLRAMLGA
ncbi:MAG TPA: alpha/beta hydrolase fold domain-containing protein [Gaiellaceae bacterium]|nr:alpha/beta hydrolase fold domain-containing protein [Gaiellaceae bacterium]